MEAESHTATLSAGLVSLEESSATPEVIDPLMRAAHSLKGAVRIVGLDAIVRVAHAMEDCFVAAQKGTLALRPEHVDVLLRGVDMLAQVAQLGEIEVEAWQTEHADEIDALVAELKSAKDDRLPARTVKPSSSIRPPEPIPVSAAPPATEGERSEATPFEDSRHAGTTCSCGCSAALTTARKRWRSGRPALPRALKRAMIASFESRPKA